MLENQGAGTVPAVIQKIRQKVYDWLGLKSFFYVIIGLLAAQSLWIALTARYPQAFDENYHFGLIQLHAQQWLPYFTSQPDGADIYGAVSRDPSYLYHFLFSLPYRLLASLTDNLAVQVITLRLLNIGLFVGGLFVYRRVLIELGLSRRLVHVVLLFFVITPIMPLLAAQINYDNLIFLLTALLFLYTVRFLRALREDGLVQIGFLLPVIFYILFAGLVKYTSTPLSLAVLFIIAVTVIWKLRDKKSRLTIIWPARIFLVGYSLIILVLGGLFLERYGINMARYYTPVPDCSDVLTTEQCMSYSPWARDYQYELSYPKPTAQGIIVYPVVWVHRMVWETMFTVSSRFYPGTNVVEYVAAPPLTVANYTAWTIVVAGTVLVIGFWRLLWAQTYLRLLLLAIAFYTVVLFIKNFSMYLNTGEAMAIHGRYLIPVYPVLYAALALAFGWLFERFSLPQLKTWLVIITLLFFVHGAGITVWLFRSDPLWYWSSDPAALVYQINNRMQDVIHRIILP